MTPRRQLVAAGVLFAATIGLVARDWIGSIACAIPDHDVAWGADARLIVYVLTWLGRALLSHPRALFDAPVGYPAPRVLTGSEHFLGLQVLFAPLLAVTHNHVLAANLSTLVSYWASAFVMFALLRRVGLGFGASVGGGLANAFGALQLPADLHQLQYPAWGVPLVLLAIEHVRGAATARAAAVLALALVVTALTSYQLAANVLLVLGVSLVVEAIARGPDATRIIRAHLAALAPVLVVLLLVSLPYLPRLGEPIQIALSQRASAPPAVEWFRVVVAREIDPVLAALALAGAVLAYRVPHRAKHLAFLAATAAATATLLALGSRVSVGNQVVTLPYRLIAAIPGATSVNPGRLVIVVGSGIAILTACALEGVASLAHGRPLARTVGTGLLLAVVGLATVPSFPPPHLTCLPVGRDLRPADRWLAAHPGGTVLDLRRASDRDDPFGLVQRADAMLASLVHGHPVTALHTHYPPPATKLVSAFAYGPPTEQSLRALVEMTDLRWIVLPSTPWTGRLRWSDLPGVTSAAKLADGEVLEVHLRPRTDWRDRLARGPQPGQSLLGTPLGLPPAARARVEVRGPSALRTTGDRSVPIGVRVTNEGPTTWPVALDPRLPIARVTHLEIRWEGASSRSEQVRLPFDVRPGESVDVMQFATPPSAPGRYEVRVGVVGEGRTFPEESTPIAVLIEARD